MEQCPAFDNLSTGFEDIEYFRRETQIAATSIIATTIVVSQIWILLLFLPLTQLPKFMRKLDIELNFEEIFAKKKKSKIQSENESEAETESLIADEREQSKRRKRASGGVATMIIAVILIIVSTTSFVVTSESPGTVSYQTNQLSEIYNLIDKSTTSLGLLFDFPMIYRVINTYVVYSNPWQNIHNRTCDMKHIKLDNSYSRVRFVLNADKFDTNEYGNTLGFQIYATVCRSQPYAERISISANTPVRPTLSSYPPPGIFTDGPTIIKSGEIATSKTVPVVSLTWSWTEMVSTSVLDLLAPLSTSRKLQAKVSSVWSTRGINSTFTYIDPSGSREEYPWPTCDKLKNDAVLSFVISYQAESLNNESYIVSERSFLSWAFATLITLGSVIALKPTITNYLDKLSNYWRMKLWARWTLFVLYTLLMPLPMLLVLFKFITHQDRLQVRGADFSYYMSMTVLLIVMAGLLMLTWVGVLARHIYMTRQESIKKRREREEQVNLIVESQDNADAGYEEIKSSAVQRKKNAQYFFHQLETNTTRYAIYLIGEMEECAAFNASTLGTGFEDIEYFRRETQIAATSIIATTIILSQILLLLLFLPISQLPKCMRKLDIELNFEEIFAKKKKSKIQNENDSETESLIEDADERERSKRRKRASGGVATMIIVVILILVSTTSFVVTSESPGTVSYQTNQLSHTGHLHDESTTSLGLLFEFDSMPGIMYIVHSDYSETQRGIISNRTCEMKEILPLTLRTSRFALDAGNMARLYYQSFEIYATVCQNGTRFPTFSISTYTPVRPSLSSYPPPGIFVDRNAVIKNAGVATSTTVPVVSLTWTWTEMVSTSVLDLLATLSTSRKLQAKVSSTLGMRDINSTFTFLNSSGKRTEYPWPTCNQPGDEPVLSFIISYQYDSSDNESYVVSERSFLSWAFATLITLGSVIALKPTITNYLDKLSNYWRMKLWARWTLFVLYTLLMPLPMLLIVLQAFSNRTYIPVRGVEQSGYSLLCFMLLVVMASLMVVTWVGVVVRHIYVTRLDCIKKRKEKEDQVSIIVESPENRPDVGYEEIK